MSKNKTSEVNTFGGINRSSNLISNNPSTGYRSKWNHMMSKRHVHAHDSYSLIHNSENRESTLESVNGWMPFKNVAYTDNSLLFSLEKQRNSIIWDNMGEVWWHYSKYKKPSTEKQILRDCIYTVDLWKFECIEPENQKVAARGWGGDVDQRTHSFS